jgi:hypothetical protein
METPPYTVVLVEVIQKLQNSSSSARLTWLPSTSEGAAQKLPLLYAVHDCDDDDHHHHHHHHAHNDGDGNINDDGFVDCDNVQFQMLPIKMSS